MARGKYLSLEEARRLNQINQFCAEHPSRGNWKEFDALMDSFTSPDARSSSEAVRTSSRARGGGSSGTRTHRDTSEDASD
jgi:hypothetical protein